MVLLVLDSLARDNADIFEIPNCSLVIRTLSPLSPDERVRETASRGTESHPKTFTIKTVCEIFSNLIFIGENRPKNVNGRSPLRVF